jgi:hypothetical protein
MKLFRSTIYITKGENNLEKLLNREGDFRIVPVVDENHSIVNVINFRKNKSYFTHRCSYRGRRRATFATLDGYVPNHSLKVGNKAIMEHNLTIGLFGIDDFKFPLNILWSKLKVTLVKE